VGQLGLRRGAAGALSVRRLAPFALFLALATGFLWEPIATGKAFLPTDLAFRFDQLWFARAAARPPDQVSQNALLADVSDYYHPYRVFAFDELRHGRLPLWNPFILTGMPFHAAAQSALLDPVNVLTLPLGPVDSWTWGAWLRLALLGCFSFGFARELGRSRVAAAGAGVVFMLSGFVVAWLNYPVVTSLVWMPALFWASTRLLATRSARALAATAAAIGGLLIGGHPETQFLVGVVWALYVAHELWRAPGDAPRRSLAALAAAVVLGGALSAVQWLPFMEFLLASHAFRTRVAPLAPFDALETALRAALLVAPDLGGRRFLYDTWLPFFMNRNEVTGYIGALALALAVVGWRAGRRAGGADARRSGFLAGAAALMLLIALRAPGFHLVKALPLLDVGHGVRWLLVASFCGALLCARGLDAIRDAERPELPRRLGAALVAAALLGLAALALVWLWCDASTAKTVVFELRGEPVVVRTAALARLFDPARGAVHAPFLFLLAGGIVLLFAGRAPARARRAALVLCGLLYLDLWTFGRHYNPVTPEADIFPPTPTTRLLSERLGHDRLVAGGDLLRPNVGMVFGFRDVRGLEDVIDDAFDRLYGETLAGLGGEPWPSRARLSDADRRLLDLASVRFFLTSVPLRGELPAGFRHVLEAELVHSYENAGAVPRAYAVLRAHTAPDLDAARAILLDPAFDPHREVVLTGPPAEPAGQAGEVAPVAWKRDGANSMVVEVELPQPGHLVLTDLYDPAWQGRVDGRAAPLLRANGAFRAVAVPAGRHEVRFDYRPRSFPVGASVSAAGALAVLWLAARGRRGRRVEGA
jgi:hypothetical protein